MAIEQFYRFSCDSHSCNESWSSSAEVAGKNQVVARTELAKKGWSSDSYRRDFCPDCTKRDAPPTREPRE